MNGSKQHRDVIISLQLIIPQETQVNSFYNCSVSSPSEVFPHEGSSASFHLPTDYCFHVSPFFFFFSPSQRKGCALVKYMFRYFVAGVYGIDLNLMPHFGSGFFLSTAWNLENTFTTNAQQLLSLTQLFCINFFQTKAIIFRLSKGNWISLHRLAKERTI